MENENINDDVIFEETIEARGPEFVEGDEGEELSKDKIKKLREDLKNAQSEKADYLLQLQKERADFINYKKGEEDRKKQTLNYARENFVEELLPVLDAYDMMSANKEAWAKVDKAWSSGVEYIHAQLLKVLSDNGITEIAPNEGADLDANIHEGVDVVETDNESKEHKIAVVVQKGYKNGDRIIRPARVKVWEYKK